MAVNAAGDVYLAHSGNNRVQKFMRDGNGLAAWGPLGTGAYPFFNVQGIAIDAQDNVHIADIGGGLSKYGPGETFLYRRTLPGADGVAVSADGYVYVVSAYQNRVVTCLASTGVVQLDFGRLGTGDGRLDTPVGDGLLADMRNRRIRRFTANGIYESQWPVYSADGYGPMSPVRLTTDAQGNPRHRALLRLPAGHAGHPRLVARCRGRRAAVRHRISHGRRDPPIEGCNSDVRACMENAPVTVQPMTWGGIKALK